MKYWNQHSLPVILVLHNPDDKLTLWQWADLKTARTTARRWCIDVPKTKVFSATSKAELLCQVWRDDSVGLRRRFAFDRQLVKRMESRNVFATIDLWLNKSLRFREIELRFDDPDKPAADYVIPIMVTWHYEIPDLMRHFLPWLDYGYYGEPESCAEEVERHVMEVWLSNPAKAFLELEAFFDSEGTE